MNAAGRARFHGAFEGVDEVALGFGVWVLVFLLLWVLNGYIAIGNRCVLAIGNLALSRCKMKFFRVLLFVWQFCII